MTFRRRPCLRLVLLALVTGSALGCDPARVEQTRRRIEADASTPGALAAIEARIADVTSRVGTEGIDQELEDESIPGIAIAVIDQGRVEWVEGYGTFATGDDREVDLFTLFQGASLSKPVTAVLALQLVEEGLLALDGDIAPVLQSWSLPENAFTATDPITPRRIMSHTAGFTLSGFIGYPPGAPLPTLLQVLDGLPPARNPAIEVAWRAGERWSYSGGGVLVLQQVIEDVSGESLGQRARRRVFEPTQMWSSHFDQPLPAADEWRAALGAPVGSFGYPELAAAGLWSHPLDLARFVIAIQRSLAGDEGALLQPATVAEMLERQTPGPSVLTTGFADGGMGLGFFLRGRPEARWFWHTGGNWGFESVLVGSIEGGRGAVVMTNGFGGRLVAWDVVDAIADVYGWTGW